MHLCLQILASSSLVVNPWPILPIKKYFLHDYVSRPRNNECPENLSDDCLKVKGIRDGLLCLSGLGSLLHQS